MVPGHEALRADTGANEVLSDDDRVTVSGVEGGFIVSVRLGEHHHHLVRHYAVELGPSVKVYVLHRSNMVYNGVDYYKEARARTRRRVLDLCLWAVTKRTEK